MNPERGNGICKCGHPYGFHLGQSSDFRCRLNHCDCKDYRASSGGNPEHEDAVEREETMEWILFEAAPGQIGVWPAHSPEGRAAPNRYRKTIPVVPKSALLAAQQRAERMRLERDREAAVAVASEVQLLRRAEKAEAERDDYKARAEGLESATGD